MKKNYIFLAIALLGFNFAIAGGGCIVDSSNHQFLAPHPDSIPCIEREHMYGQTIQLYVPDSIDLINYGSPFSFVLYVDSVVFNGFDGLPVYISNTVNPASGVYYPGQFVCVQLTGSTQDTIGHYFLVPNGSITAHGTPYLPIFDGDTTVDLANLQLMAQGDLDMYVDVIDYGSACRNLWPARPCIPDQSNTEFFSPRPDSLPCVERTEPYSEVIQIAVPTSINLQDFGAPFPFILYVDSVVITSANGLPSNITYEANPANGVMYGGEFGCALVHGTTTDGIGRYPITFNGSFTAHGTPYPPFFDGDTTIDFADLAAVSQGRFELFLDVIEPNTPCRNSGTGLGDFDADLNSLLSVYPNPSAGVFTFSLNSGRRITGEVSVTDITGRKAFVQQIDWIGNNSSSIDLSGFAKGLYSFKLTTTEGSSTRSISLE